MATWVRQAPAWALSCQLPRISDGQFRGTAASSVSTLSDRSQPGPFGVQALDRFTGPQAGHDRGLSISMGLPQGLLDPGVPVLGVDRLQRATHQRQVPQLCGVLSRPRPPARRPGRDRRASLRYVPRQQPASSDRRSLGPKDFPWVQTVLAALDTAPRNGRFREGRDPTLAGFRQRSEPPAWLRGLSDTQPPPAVCPPWQCPGASFPICPRWTGLRPAPPAGQSHR